jgi:hypothetical protein
MKSRLPIVVAIILLLLPLLYLASYLALVQPSTVIFTAQGINQPQTIVIAQYRFGGRTAALMFWPLEQIDRTVRPTAWNARFDEAVGFYMSVAK